ncbi:uncharacterized protein LOC105845232 isoform X1 [Hydra vulgaris]|uniref:uncharacterized protein LOC105845232 isoform X1 n=1 Tax=Hydra vulgaris TaxID=6087 RepID=UPI001F5F9A67|nr:uncharacterized protein LOC105845232 [Hydra vulgaris]
MFNKLTVCLIFVYILPGQMLVPDQVFFWPIKPFIFYESDGNLDGILPFMYKRLQELCCPSIDLVQYHLINKTFDQNKFYKSLEKEKNANKELQNYTGKNGIWFPILIKADENILKSRNVKQGFFIYSPNIGVIVNKNKITVSRKILEAIKKSLPIASHAIGFILLFSLLVWLVESLKNNDFSKFFIQGFGTSLWWSFVTFATVGYGDIVPKSFLGRAFSVLWMITGIILVSGLTGMFSSIITTNSFLSIQNEEIAVLNNSIELVIAQKNFNVTAKRVYYTYNDVFSDVNDNKVDYGVINIDVLLNMEYKKDYSNVVLVQLLDALSPIVIVFGIETYLMSFAYPSTLLQNDDVLNCIRKLNIKEILKNIQEIYGKIPIIDTEVQQNFSDIWNESYIKNPGIVVLTLISVLIIKDVIHFIYKMYGLQNHRKVLKKTEIGKNADVSLKKFSNCNINADTFLANKNDLLRELLIIKEHIFLLNAIHKNDCLGCLKQDHQICLKPK